MMHCIRWAIALPLVLTMTLVLIACGSDDDDDEMDMGGAATAGTMPTGSATMDAGMMATATMDPGMMGTPGANMDMDLMFIDSMIPHHQSAIGMAEVALEEAEHQEIKDLAQAIISAQQAEIDQMMAWREQWFPGAAQSGGMPGMGGMTGMEMTDEEMRMLREADPFDEAFIDMMISHHESAIAMAQEILKTTQRPELQQLANDIISAQQAEIEQMQEWRQAWFGS